MSNHIRCRCRRCTIRGLMGPAVLITLGILFLLDQTYSGFSFRQTWPVILLVLGVISLASATAPMDGHIPDSPVPPVTTGGTPIPPVGTSVPPATPAPASYPRQAQ
jgi:Domain of unknown function (DUF5668)